jgi:hypothetical protein
MVYMPRFPHPPQPLPPAQKATATAWLTRQRRQRRLVIGIALTAVITIAAAITFLLTRPGPPPSAQCKAQVAQIALLENDAATISDSGQVVSADAISRFNADVLSASVRLRQAKKAGCPATGYPGGYTLK